MINKHNISYSVTCISDISADTDTALDSDKLVEYFIRHSTDIPALEKNLSLSLTCPDEVPILLLPSSTKHLAKYGRLGMADIWRTYGRYMADIRPMVGRYAADIRRTCSGHAADADMADMADIRLIYGGHTADMRRISAC